MRFAAGGVVTPESEWALIVPSESPESEWAPSKLLGARDPA